MPNRQKEKNNMTYTGNTAPQQPAHEPTKTVVFGGTVTKEPELRMTQNNQAVINIDFAVNQLNGETHWGRATVWGTDAYIAADFCRKGEPIAGVADFKVTTREFEGKTYTNNEYNVKSLFLSTKDILGIVDQKIEAAMKPKEETQDTTREVVVETPTQEEPETIQIDTNDLPF